MVGSRVSIVVSTLLKSLSLLLLNLQYTQFSNSISPYSAPFFYTYASVSSYGSTCATGAESMHSRTEEDSRGEYNSFINPPHSRCICIHVGKTYEMPHVVYTTC
ncbi:hypothetical protein PF005_g19363 [Phytophthora fragariae]|uniref:Secreted protein n=1 Tax=Phytophthora fragariae TaxID=53985 RepID=A0A6A4CP77_9STRA|nr:hypothetical protein PF009_g20988 [Phytophthora fragariae]KAE9089384.1 hypothetical protein PF007_g19618 [Phytophthora fragariae]KAE9116638.1 hypothetical protein PF006_g18989 [Phytophthora fragariae]KAE9190163.1 hypothetical protein PF005_g19363 [Phytophthora fragariae]KAE9202301.1 hypothetical protein PF002_g21286 [Phytophthora fragariae]